MTTTTKANAITAREVTRAIIESKPLFILDVRNTSDYDDWKIEGGIVGSLNVPYFDLIDGVEEVLPKLPKDRDILVVCAKEGSSIFVAEQLGEAGIEGVRYLQGGMKAWSEYLEPVKVGDLKDGGELYQFVRMGKGCLSYMVVSEGEAAVVDTLRMTDVFEKFAKSKGAVIKHTLDTHLHADHISGGRKLAEQSGGTYWLPPKDADEVVFEYHPLDEQSRITVGRTELSIRPVYSPGHTIGSTSIVIDNQYLLSGDILFVESIGRPDLAGNAGSWADDLRKTLYSTYKELSGDLLVLPAHFGKTSELGEGGRVAARLGDLYESNPGLNIASDEEFRKTVTTNLPSQPNAYQEIRQTNMGRIVPNDDEQRDMEIGPNRCAVHDK
ncbi:MBL fold metallo-hydrolase [Cohnella endophytica]|uniref:MBL fold metallo-hydrolase n=1 Tax=Cohnella endophytica TaxID=2419778 RepID=A0A494XWH3_9BACL|nr:MBL fold metallo-hydrolase [Cohnella endophytica]RKP54034.1 MBL fold metallo-hydrolase [Cohnella endophytica]